jgi:hypothetical protein
MWVKSEKERIIYSAEGRQPWKGQIKKSKRNQNYVTDGKYITAGITKSVRVGKAGFDSRQGQEFLFSPLRADRRWSTPSFLSNGCWGNFYRREGGGGLKWPEYDVDHSPPSSIQGKNTWGW